MNIKRINNTFFIIAVGLLFVSLSFTAYAQEERAAGTEKGQFSLFVEAGYKSFFGVDQTFNALYDSSASIGFGMGAKYKFPFGLFFMADINYHPFSGERVWVSSNGTVLKTGIQEDLVVLPLFVTIGYMPAMKGDMKVYFGIGGSYYMVSTSSPDDASLGSDENGTGYHGLLGVEFPLGKNMTLSVEGKYEIVTGIIGGSGQVGVARVFEEDDLGGFSLFVKVGLAL